VTRQRVLTGPGADGWSGDEPGGGVIGNVAVAAQDAPTIPAMKRAFRDWVANGVAICRMVFDWKERGGPERDLDDPETWDRYLAACFGLVPSSIRGMVGQGAALLQLQQSGAQLEDVRQSHLKELSRLRHEPELLEEAWVAAGERVATDGRKRMTATDLKESVREILVREGRASRPIDPDSKLDCPHCGGKGWTWKDPGPPGVGPLTG